MDTAESSQFKPRTIAATAASSLLFGVMIVLGGQATAVKNIDYHNPFLYCIIVLWAIAFYIAENMVIYLLKRYWQMRAKAPVAIKPEESFFARNEYRIIAIVLIAESTIAILAAWPGFFCYDAYSEFQCMEPGQTLNTAHPILHVLLLNGVIRGVESLTGSYNLGIAAFLFLQSLFITWVIVYTLKWMKRCGVPRWMRTVSTIWYMTNPILVMFSICSTKDVLFSILILLLAVVLLDDSSRSSLGMPDCIKFGILIFLTCSLRNNMLYAYLLALPFVCWLLKKFWKQLLLTSAVAIALFLIWSRPFAVNVLHASTTYYQESLTVLAQQMARANENDPNMNPDERAAIREVCDYPVYFEELGDITKNSLISDTGKIIRTWLYVGRDHKGMYNDAFIHNTMDAWYPPAMELTAYNYPERTDQDYNASKTSLFACWVEAPGVLNSKISGLYNVMWTISREGVLEGLPVLRCFVSIPFCVWILILVLTIGISCKLHGLTAVSILLGTIVLSFLFGPVVLIRYYLYLFYVLPLLVSQLFVVDERV